ncbi:hypothetical protein [Pandoraea oxalativorans]|uniref:hypothetical protein n=1 Tax=Pandoraea oxalativorans TaxID=573737 RepID=UPI000A440A33|nr:hypothetical protein [Pandoraea oxalativorans]
MNYVLFEPDMALPYLNEDEAPEFPVAFDEQAGSVTRRTVTAITYATQSPHDRD